MQAVTITQITPPELEALIESTMKRILSASPVIQPAPKREDSDFLNISGAMEVTGLEKSTIYNLWSQGKIPGYKKSRRLYFKKSELIAWIESGKRRTVKEIAGEV